MKLRSETYKNGAIHSSILSVGSKIAAFTMQLLIAYYYGANTSTDIFFYLYGISILLGSYIQSLCTSVLIPHAMTLRQKSIKEEMSFHNAHFYFFTILGILLLALFFVSFEYGFTKWIINYPLDKIEKNLYTCYCFFPFTLLLTSINYLSEILISYKYFSVGILSMPIINICSIITLLCLGNHFSIQILMLSCSVTSFFILLAILLFMKQKLNWDFTIVRYEHLKDCWKHLMGISLNQVVLILTNIIPLYLLSGYQSGIVTIVNYAQKIVQVPLAWIQQIASVLQVKLNTLYTSNTIGSIKREAMRVTLRLFIFTLFTSLITFILSNFISTHLYGLGRIEEEKLSSLSELIRIMTWGLPFTVLSLCFIKVYISLQYIRRYIYIIFSTGILSCLGYYWFIQNQVENGYALMYVFTEILISICIILFTPRHFSHESSSNQ